jgi:hypothetical protein
MKNDKQKCLSGLQTMVVISLNGNRTETLAVNGSEAWVAARSEILQKV